MNKLYFDGSSSPKKKDKAGWGFFLDKGTTSLSCTGALPPDSTNNFAEYTALIEGLKFCIKNNIDNITVIGDSQIVIYQMTGKYKIKNPALQILNIEAQGLVKQFSNISFSWQRREFNLADAVSRV